MTVTLGIRGLSAIAVALLLLILSGIALRTELWSVRAIGGIGWEFPYTLAGYPQAGPLPKPLPHVPQSSGAASLAAATCINTVGWGNVLECRPLVDEFILAAPGFGAGWILRANVLLSGTGELSSDVIDAFWRSVAYSPNEGWVAESRVGFGLNAWTLLPPAERDQVRKDLLKLIQSGMPMERLANLLKESSLARENVLVLAADLPPSLAERFLGLLKGKN
jgi:hypothetical protein